jgi:uncharacterized membrane protein YqjE
MKTALCFFGIILIFLSALLWVASSPTGLFSVSFHEFVVMFLLGVVLTIPKIRQQMRLLLSSGKKSKDAPF